MTSAERERAIRVERRILAENSEFLGILAPALFNRAVNISLKNRYVYLETPKAACSTIKLALYAVEVDDPSLAFESPDDIHIRELAPLLTPAQAGPLRRYVGDPAFFKFCFVRNPFTRLLSTYLDKIERNRPQKRVVLERLGRAGDLAQPVAFDEFVDVVAGQSPSDMNGHWQIQWHQTLQDRIAYDLVGRVERFEPDFRRVLERIAPDPARFPIDERRHATDADMRVRDFYDGRLADIVRRVYAQDFNGFGYSGDLPG